MERKRYHIVIASIIFAILVWISINMAEEYTLVKHVPVVVENLKEGKALKFAVPKTIVVSFKGRGWQLAAIYFSSDVRYYIDMLSLSIEEYMVTKRDFFEHVKLPMAVQPVDVKPETLVLALADYKEKRVPLVPQVILSYREGYGQVGPLHIFPDSVLVGGAANLIETISRWQTVYRKYDNQHNPVNEELGVEEPTDFSLNVVPSTVHLQVDVQPFAEKTFSGIPLTATLLPPNREVIFIPPKIDLIVRGGIDQLARLSASDFQASIAYEALVQDTTGIITPLVSAPSEVSVIRRTPERFQFIIRKKL